MTDQHPITPPPELVQEWAHMLEQHTDTEVFAAATRWGADQELAACCADLRMVLGPDQADWLRSVRRPKPPSLKEQALETLRQMHIDPETGVSPTALDTIRRALEQLDDH